MEAYRDQYAQLFHDGHNVVLIAISADPDTALASWARDDQFPFLMASDTGLVAATAYGTNSTRGHYSTRDLFVIGPDGRITYVDAPFREIDPTAYRNLAQAINQVTPASPGG
jgi:thioredoxin-dependent peroxiredoxin